VGRRRLRGERGAFLPQRGATAGVADVFVIDVREPAKRCASSLGSRARR
jgi:hypothetical protein